VRINIILKFRQINRLRRLILSITILLFAQQFVCNSQNLYNPENSQKYAEYLFSSSQYKLAAEEYERLVYFDENNIGFKYNLIKSYRLSGDLNLGIRRIYSFYGNALDIMPQSLATEFVKLQILSDSSLVVEKFLQQNNSLPAENKAIYHCSNLLLIGKYKEAGSYIKTTAGNSLVFPQKMLLLAETAEKIKYKSPLLAGSFSAIIPGTGKFYTKNWVDGIFSLLFVAGNAWQSYRGFSEHGIKSGYGWFFGGLSVSFYIGNIFGSAKAAKRYNNGKKDEIDNQIYEFIRSDNF
jgi:hypothetical protein